MAADPKMRMDMVLRIAGDARCTRVELALASVLLLRCYNSTNGRCDPGKRLLAKMAATTERHVARSMRRLQELGYFRIGVGAGTATKTGPTNSYVPIFDGVTATSRDDAQVTPEGVTATSRDDLQVPEGVTATSPKHVSEHVSKSRAEADASGGKPPSPEAMVFQRGKILLGKSSGGQITKLRNAFGRDDTAVLAILTEAEGKENPAEWVAGVIRKRGEPPETDDLGLPKTPIDQLGAWTDDLYQRLGVER